jgi:2-polyprenyl-3-methyl-5-hydroxy-6-metoxy-1,4-benzoquinol methylase
MMNKNFDWTSYSDDPNNEQARADVLPWLRQIRRVHLDSNLLDYVCERTRGKRVLDIGVVSHSALSFEDQGWRHRRIRDTASYCVGVDILEPLVDELNKRGFDVRCVDATSDADIGERFDVVFLGDVIEHVDNPVALLRFASRHLAPSGRILVSTPNPFSRKFYRRFRRDGTPIVNLDHCAWFTPTTALELARRAKLMLIAYHLAKPFSRTRRFYHKLLWYFEPLEYSFTDYIFEFAWPTAETETGTLRA